MILVFLLFCLKAALSPSSFTLINRFFISFSFSAIRAVSSAYLRLWMFLPPVLTPACNLSSPAFLMMCSAYGLNKRGDSRQPCCTPFSILSQSVVPHRLLTVAFRPSYNGFLRRQVRRSGVPISKSFPCFVTTHTQPKAVICQRNRCSSEIPLLSLNPANVGKLISSSSSFSKLTSRPLPQNAWSSATSVLSFPVLFHACKLTHVQLFSTSWSAAARLLRPWDFPGKNTVGGCHFLLQGIFPTQGLNPCLLHWGFLTTELLGKSIFFHAAAAAKSLQSCPTLCDPIDGSPPGSTSLHRPWDSPGKNTGVGCHFLLQCMKVKSESEVIFFHRKEQFLVIWNCYFRTITFIRFLTVSFSVLFLRKRCLF